MVDRSEEIRAVLEHPGDAVGVVPGVDRQVEDRLLRVGLDIASLHSAEVELVLARGLRRKCYLYHRVVAQGALGPQLLDQPLEGERVVLVGLQAHSAYLREQIFEGRVAGEVDAYWHRVHEEPDHVLQIHATTVGAGHSNQDIVPVRVAMEKHREHGQEDHRRGHLLLDAEPLIACASVGCSWNGMVAPRKLWMAGRP